MKVRLNNEGIIKRKQFFCVGFVVESKCHNKKYGVKNMVCLALLNVVYA